MTKPQIYRYLSLAALAAALHFYSGRGADIRMELLFSLAQQCELI